MPNDRDRLIELISQAKNKCGNTTNCIECAYYNEDECKNHNIADHLLSNGVIVPPCNLGDTIYIVDFSDNYTEMIVKEAVVAQITYLNSKRGVVYYVICKEGTGMSYGWNEDAFSTKEEAEEKLKEYEGK